MLFFDFCYIAQNKSRKLLRQELIYCDNVKDKRCGRSSENAISLLLTVAKNFLIFPVAVSVQNADGPLTCFF